MDVLFSLTAIIVSQCLYTSKYHVVQCKYKRFSLVNYLPQYSLKKLFQISKKAVSQTSSWYHHFPPVYMYYFRLSRMIFSKRHKFVKQNILCVKGYKIPHLTYKNKPYEKVTSSWKGFLMADFKIHIRLGENNIKKLNCMDCHIWKYLVLFKWKRCILFK